MLALACLLTVAHVAGGAARCGAHHGLEPALLDLQFREVLRRFGLERSGVDEISAWVPALEQLLLAAKAGNCKQGDESLADVTSSLETDSRSHNGFEPCWRKRSGGFSFEHCCTQESAALAGSPGALGNPSCFDPIFTYERCCEEAEENQMCWEVARGAIDEWLSYAMPAGPLNPVFAQHIEALQGYKQDDMLLYVFCCAGHQNDYCWGHPDSETLLPAPDFWSGYADATRMYSQCCFPRLSPMLRATSPPKWMQLQIDRDLREFLKPGAPPWPSRETLLSFLNSLSPEDKQTICDFHVTPREVRHCNFTERGYKSRNDLRIRIFARALHVLAARGELPDAEFTFLMRISDIEWEDHPVPVVTFQRGKATKRTIRVPMWEQLDASWTNKVDQIVRQYHYASLPKKAWRVFWRGTDSNVPAGDCNPLYPTCEVTPETARLFPRLRLVQLSQAHPRRINAKLSGAKQRSRNVGLDKLYLRLGFLDTQRTREWTIEEQLQFRYLLDVDGSSQSTRLYWALLSKSLVFKQVTASCNWYSDRLRPYVHFVPVRRDLADLPSKVSWARRHPRAARHMAQRAARLAERWLSHEDSMHYLARVMMAIARLPREGSSR